MKLCSFDEFTEICRKFLAIRQASDYLPNFLGNIDFCTVKIEFAKYW